MPQLDFREALSTPGEQLFSPAATVTEASAASIHQDRNLFVRGVRFSRSTWANIFFVTIASVGGLVCAFYFFNGGELLRAAAAWPSEFLYPRPGLVEKIEVGVPPAGVDQFANIGTSESGSTKAENLRTPADRNVGSSDFFQPATAIAASNPTIATPSEPGPTFLPAGPSLPVTPTLPETPSLPVTPLPTGAPTLPSGLGLPSVPGIDSLLQSLHPTAPTTRSGKTIVRNGTGARSSIRRKVSSTQKLVANQTNSTTQVTKSTSQNLQQQTFNQTQMPMNSIQSSSQMMSGGLGGGIGGAAGGVGGGLGGGLGGLGGTVGGVLGGHH